MTYYFCRFFQCLSDALFVTCHTVIFSSIPLALTILHAACTSQRLSNVCNTTSLNPVYGMPKAKIVYVRAPGSWYWDNTVYFVIHLLAQVQWWSHFLFAPCKDSGWHATGCWLGHIYTENAKSHKLFILSTGAGCTRGFQWCGTVLCWAMILIKPSVKNGRITT